MEAEFVAFSAAVQEVVWLRRFLNHLGLCENETDLVLVHSDSQTTIAYTKDPKYHSKTKHIDTKYNFVRDMVVKKQVCMQYIYLHTKWWQILLQRQYLEMCLLVMSNL
jgi:hypothetical protein